MTGGGEFSNDVHLTALREESNDGQKNRDDVNNATLKGLVGDLLGNKRKLILWAKNTAAWPSVRVTTVSGTLLSDM